MSSPIKKESASPLIPLMPEKKRSQESETSFSGKHSLRIRHIRAQLLGSGIKVLMERKPKIGRNPQSAGVRWEERRKATDLSQDQEGLSIGSRKKAA